MSAERGIMVIGGGIAGLAVATLLARRGGRVTVIERAALISEVGAGLQISPNGAVVLRAMGLGGGGGLWVEGVVGAGRGRGCCARGLRGGGLRGSTLPGAGRGPTIFWCTGPI